jgi:hypothetical protein
MSYKILKKLLGEAGGGADKSHGTSNQLYDLLLAFISGFQLNAIQVGAITATVKGGMVMRAGGKLGKLVVNIGTCGTAGSTVVSVLKNGVALATTVTVAHNATDGSTAEADLSTLATAEYVTGDLIQISVTTAPTNGADLTASLGYSPVVAE